MVTGVMAVGKEKQNILGVLMTTVRTCCVKFVYINKQINASSSGKVRAAMKSTIIKIQGAMKAIVMNIITQNLLERNQAAVMNRRVRTL